MFACAYIQYMYNTVQMWLSWELSSWISLHTRHSVTDRWAITGQQDSYCHISVSLQRSLTATHCLRTERYQCALITRNKYCNIGGSVFRGIYITLVMYKNFLITSLLFSGLDQCFHAVRCFRLLNTWLELRQSLFSLYCTFFGSSTIIISAHL